MQHPLIRKQIYPLFICVFYIPGPSQLKLYQQVKRRATIPAGRLKAYWLVLFFEEDSDAFLNGLICSKMSSKSAFELLRNYHALSPFSKGRLLEYSEKLMEWDRQKAAHLHDVETLRHTIF